MTWSDVEAAVAQLRVANDTSDALTTKTTLDFITSIKDEHSEQGM